MIGSKKERSGQMDVVLKTEKRLPKEIDFVEHVQPVLELNCVACHYEGK